MGFLNWLDWILAATVVLSVVAAVVQGFVRELIAFASVVVGLIISALGYRRAAPWFEDLARSHDVALGVGFLALFLGTLLAGLVISLLARRLIQTVGLEWFDRLLGGVFGLIRGVAISSVLLMALVAFGIKTETVQNSLLAPYLLTGARVVAAAMPQELKAHFRAGFDEFRRALAESDRKLGTN
jgi:membrane protein required for colicin V production